jgi:hypothetical protein
LKLYVDPALRLQGSSPIASADAALDDAGISWTPDKNSDAVFFSSAPRRSLVNTCDVSLKYPQPNVGKKIARLNGTVQLQLADLIESMTIDNPLTAAETKKIAGHTTVTFHSMKTTNQAGQYQAIVTITRDIRDFGSNDFWNLLQSSSHLLDDQNRPFAYVGGSGGAFDGKYYVNYSRPARADAPQGDPARWVLELPAQAHTVSIPFQFKDLPLP